MTATTTDIRTLAKTTDNELFPIEGEIFMLEQGVKQLQKRLRLGEQTMRETRAAQLREQIAAAATRAIELDETAEPLRETYSANRWTRFILVPGGHLHRGTGCSTLRYNTDRQYLPDFSGADETEVVDLAGERACTVCFPTAPVDRPSMLPVDIEAREVAAQERAEKAAKLDAEAFKFMADDRQPFKIGRERLKTVRSAENHVGWQMECAIRSMAYDFVDEAHRQQLIGNAAADMREAVTTAEAVEQRTTQFDQAKPAAELLAKKYTAKRKEAIKNGWDADRIPTLEDMLELAK